MRATTIDVKLDPYNASLFVRCRNLLSIICLICPDFAYETGLRKQETAFYGKELKDAGRLFSLASQ
jgi:hypothetical protein